MKHFIVSLDGFDYVEAQNWLLQFCMGFFVEARKVKIMFLDKKIGH